jgi:hypothetical protein
VFVCFARAYNIPALQGDVFDQQLKDRSREVGDAMAAGHTDNVCKIKFLKEKRK